jgi:hypothetical protein
VQTDLLNADKILEKSVSEHSFFVIQGELTSPAGTDDGIVVLS